MSLGKVSGVLSTLAFLRLTLIRLYILIAVCLLMFRLVYCTPYSSDVAPCYILVLLNISVAVVDTKTGTFTTCSTRDSFIRIWCKLLNILHLVL